MVDTLKIGDDGRLCRLETAAAPHNALLTVVALAATDL